MLLKHHQSAWLTIDTFCRGCCSACTYRLCSSNCVDSLIRLPLHARPIFDTPCEGGVGAKIVGFRTYHNNSTSNRIAAVCLGTGFISPRLPQIRGKTAALAP